LLPSMAASFCLATALVREVKEETGVTVQVTGVVGLYWNPNPVIAFGDGEVLGEGLAGLLGSARGRIRIVVRAPDHEEASRGIADERANRGLDGCGLRRAGMPMVVGDGELGEGSLRTGAGEPAEDRRQRGIGSTGRPRSSG
jgi:hypothetical protein